jgi:hypothetical protein
VAHSLDSKDVGDAAISKDDYPGLLDALDAGSSEADIAAYYGCSNSTAHKHVVRARAERLLAQRNHLRAKQGEDLLPDLAPDPDLFEEVPGHEPGGQPPTGGKLTGGGMCWAYSERTWAGPDGPRTEPTALALDAFALSRNLGSHPVTPNGETMLWFVKELRRAGWLLPPDATHDARIMRTPDGERPRLFVIALPSIERIRHTCRKLRYESKHGYPHEDCPTPTDSTAYPFSAVVTLAEDDQWGRQQVPTDPRITQSIFGPQ